MGAQFDVIKSKCDKFGFIDLGKERLVFQKSVEKILYFFLHL